jgi:hypothetical protein
MVMVHATIHRDLASDARFGPYFRTVCETKICSERRFLFAGSFDVPLTNGGLTTRGEAFTDGEASERERP